jgi:hypothetical protein
MAAMRGSAAKVLVPPGGVDLPLPFIHGMARC